MRKERGIIMIHPSYVELMKVVNDGVEIGEEPVVNSHCDCSCKKSTPDHCRR